MVGGEVGLVIATRTGDAAVGAGGTVAAGAPGRGRVPESAAVDVASDVWAQKPRRRGNERLAARVPLAFERRVGLALADLRRWSRGIGQGEQGQGERDRGTQGRDPTQPADPAGKKTSVSEFVHQRPSGLPGNPNPWVLDRQGEGTGEVSRAETGAWRGGRTRGTRLVAEIRRRG